MAEKKSKWLVGCGIGCAVIIAILIILSITGYFFFKNKFEPLKQAKVSMEELKEAYGEIEDYCPNPTGNISKEKIGAFIKVRESLKEASSQLGETFDSLIRQSKKAEEDKSFKNVMKIIGKSFGLIPKIGSFFEKRNKALLKQKMGFGEYTYLYVISYYSWLDKSPDDGLEVARKFEEESDSESVDIKISSKKYDEDKQYTKNIALLRLNSKIISMLECQLENLKKLPEAEKYSEWQKELVEEIKKMKNNPSRIPWADKLPEQIKSSLKPYKERIESLYFKKTNFFELSEQED